MNLIATGRLAAAGLLISAAAPVAAPQSIASRVDADRFEPGDFSWARGRFPGASPQEQSDWLKVTEWAQKVAEERAATAAAAIQGMGVDPKALPLACYGSEACALIKFLERSAGSYDNWPAFQSALAEARPYHAGIKLAAQQIGERVYRLPADKLPVAERLRSATVLEQAWRGVMQDDVTKPAVPLSPGGARAFNMLAWPEAAREDRTNTEMLKGLVEKSGWPRQSEVGEQGAADAWLLAQHADDDPAFQLKALRLMEPLVASGEAPAKQFGYLYDRVMLKLVGLQRYGTQMTCKAGKFQPLPLEDPAKLETYRKSVGMPPMADYLKMFSASCS